jgi:hypothetical protein
MTLSKILTGRSYSQNQIRETYTCYSNCRYYNSCYHHPCSNCKQGLPELDPEHKCRCTARPGPCSWQGDEKAELKYFQPLLRDMGCIVALFRFIKPYSALESAKCASKASSWIFSVAPSVSLKSISPIMSTSSTMRFSESPRSRIIRLSISEIAL